MRNETQIQLILGYGLSDSPQNCRQAVRMLRQVEELHKMHKEKRVDRMKEYIVEYETEQLENGTMFYGGKVKHELIRCKDCEDCTETKLYDGQRWNYCMRLRCVVKENDFCCWAERKYPKIKAKVTE